MARDPRAAGVPSGPVNTVADALGEAHTAARDMIVETPHPRFGRVRSVATPVRVGEVGRFVPVRGIE